MHPRERAKLDVPVSLNRELARYGGWNPFGLPLWRVVLAANVLEQSFGQMAHMPRLSAAADADLNEIEPDRFTSGEMWTPKYGARGFGLERWFPASAWGGRWEWEHETSRDGTTRLKGEFPRHGDYYMVGDEWHPRLLPADAWKLEIQRWMARQASLNGDPAALLRENLYAHRLKEERRREVYEEEVNRIHRAVVDPMLATIGSTAQRVREQVALDMGWTGHLPAG
jgi:hypothetical protein